MDDERDVEIFERIPWEALEEKTDRRWVAYVVAGVVVLGAIGVSIGRQMTPAPAPATGQTTSPSAAASTSTSLDQAPPPTTASTPSTTVVAGLSEADLMALPAESLEVPAAAVAEWFVVDSFTREEADARSFVDWARAWQVEWLGSTSVEVTVLVRRLAALDDEPYQRLEPEAWEVVVELAEGGWEVVGGPIPTDPPPLDPGPDSPMAAELSSDEWTDGAGLTWQVHRRTGGP